MSRPDTRAGEVREALRRQIGDASRTLRDPALPDEAIHHARKELKRARANLRLLRPAIGGRAYARANAALRDSSRPFSAARDARVLVQTIDALLEAEQNASRRALLSKMRAQLEQQRLSAREAVHTTGEGARSADSLDAVWQRVQHWRLSRNKPGALGKGVKRIYRSTRKAYKAAAPDGTPEKLHEWRKQVKYLGAALETLDAGEGRVPTKLLRKLRGLAECLGLDHDLVVLEETLAKLHSRASHARTGIFAQIASRRELLHAEAMKNARALFRREPKAFLKHNVSRTSEQHGRR
ncbi:MAG TPA: CHAD domain-containing protein [Burkholderiales bacterium]|nr:CHAD domain-containing protein [Burkholderiales bacterium]